MTTTRITARVRRDIARELGDDPRVRHWLEQLTANPDALPGDLDDDQLAFIHRELMRRSGGGYDSSEFARAMELTAPVLRAPRGGLAAVPAIMAQPEVHEFLFEGWRGPRGARGPAPAYQDAKAVLATMAFGRTGSYVDKAHGQLAADPRLRRLMLGSAAGALAPYQSVMRLIERVTPACWEAAVETNVALLRALRSHLPEVGRRLMIDGTAIPAWCPQEGSRGNELLEAELRRLTPEAGFRAYTQTRAGKVDPHELAAARPGTFVEVTKKWRGYLLVIIADQATGLPMVWTLMDARRDEAKALVPLLADLHRLWPDLDAELIAGDSAYDEDWACRLCEVRYGIHPVFRLHNQGAEPKPLRRGDSREGTIVALDPLGRPICDTHKEPLGISTSSAPGRDGLAPGEPTKEGAHRIRAHCRHDQPGRPACGYLGLRMQADWSKLTHFPHHPDGNPARHAMRMAVLARLNGMEAINARLKVGHHIGTAGADRLRVRSKDTVSALISLSLLGMSALSLASVRAATDSLARAA